MPNHDMWHELEKDIDKAVKEINNENQLLVTLIAVLNQFTETNTVKCTSWLAMNTESPMIQIRVSGTRRMVGRNGSVTSFDRGSAKVEPWSEQGGSSKEESWTVKTKWNGR
jgi:hypothetical protein